MRKRRKRRKGRKGGKRKGRSRMEPLSAQEMRRELNLVNWEFHSWISHTTDLTIRFVTPWVRKEKIVNRYE